MAVCSLRIATNTRRKNNATGEWEDKPNYFDVTVWGAQGENCARFLAKGRPVAIDGRLEWREWDDRETGAKRQAVDIIADSVQFLGGREEAQGGGAASPRARTSRSTRATSSRSPRPPATARALAPPTTTSRSRPRAAAGPRRGPRRPAGSIRARAAAARRGGSTRRGRAGSRPPTL